MVSIKRTFVHHLVQGSRNGKTRNRLPETFAAETCLPDAYSFATRGYISARKAETYFATGNSVSRVANLGNIGQHVSATNVSGSMFPRFARA